MDFKIRWMRQHPDGWYYAKLLDLSTQNEVHAHDRWGSWMIGEPTDPSGDRRETLPLVAAGLQAYKKREQSKIKKIDPDGEEKPNPFLAKKAAKPSTPAKSNPFLQKKTKKENPFLAKKKPNPFLKNKKKTA